MGLSVLAVIALAGGYLLSNSAMETDDSMVATDYNKNDGAIDDDGVMKNDKDTPAANAMDSDHPDDSEVMMDKNSEKGEYVSYSPDFLTKYKGKTKVLFFHANWCPTCKVADRDIKDNINNIPDGAVIIKTDYDSERGLKTKYGVTYQHTFVVIDDNGEEISKWNGGSFEEILKRI